VKVSNVSKLVVLALVVMVVALALVVPIVGGAVARAGDGSTAAVYPGHIKWPGYECQSGHSCGGVPVAAMCQSGYSCGGRQVAVWPLPGTNAICQSGAACGG